MPLTEEIVKKYSKEDEQTVRVMNKCKGARKRGYLTKEEFIAICRWKSPRPLKHYNKNSEKRIKELTQKAFSTQFEKRKITLLDKLSGVNVPMASAIITLVFPEKYGVIDVRGWNSLKRLKIIKSSETKRKRYFDARDWYRYTMIVRHLAKKFKVTPRIMDRVLYFYDIDTTSDKIYG